MPLLYMYTEQTAIILHSAGLTGGIPRHAGRILLTALSGTQKHPIRYCPELLQSIQYLHTVSPGPIYSLNSLFSKK
jgi:hypothetical protein